MNLFMLTKENLQRKGHFLRNLSKKEGIISFSINLKRQFFRQFRGTCLCIGNMRAIASINLTSAIARHS